MTSSAVAIAHTKEKHLTQDRVLSLVRQAVDLLGGIRHFVTRGDTVLIKPNQTVFYSADEGCTTEPFVVGALIRLAKEAGAAHVQIAESSGGFFSSLECMSITGVAAVAEREGAELVNLGSDDVPNRIVSIPGGAAIRQVPVPEPLLNADVIIDAPKAKNHHIEPISGALKNWVGVVNQSWRNHNHGDAEHIPRFMDIMTVTRPHLCVVDALIAGEGDGPIANQPRWVGCVLASADPVATDVAICELLGHDWRELRFAEEAEKRGLGIRQPIQYLGAPLEEVRVSAWKPHEGFSYLPVNFLVGEGVRLEGTVGHVKSVLDSMLRRGELREVIWLKGTPTIMLGAIEDPLFEQHLEEGPYIVIDDAALSKYKDDSRVRFIPGHPVLQTAMPALMEALGVGVPGKAIMKWQEFQRWGMHNVQYGTRKRQLMTIAKPVAAASALVAGLLGIKWLARKITRDRRPSPR